jgi:hypothetical protein
VIKQRAGVAELVIPAHTGRAEQDAGHEHARGATRFDDWPDVRWVLTKDADHRRYLRCDGRDVNEPEQSLAYDEDTRRLTLVGGSRAGMRRNGLRGELLRFIEANPGQGVNDLRRAFPSRGVEVNKALGELVAEGSVRVQNGPNRSKRHYAMGPATDAPEAPWMQSDPQAGIW